MNLKGMLLFLLLLRASEIHQDQRPPDAISCSELGSKRLEQVKFVKLERMF